jgi:hypothetical protein
MSHNSHALAYANSVGSNTKAPMLVPEEYTQWVQRMQDHLWRVDEDVLRSIVDGPHLVARPRSRLGVSIVDDTAEAAATTVDKQKLRND